jgi:hypothetical protein
MPKIIGEQTKQLSVRVDEKDLERVDAIRAQMKKKTGIEPQRSDVVRMILLSGLSTYEAQVAKKSAEAQAAKKASKEQS